MKKLLLLAALAAALAATSGTSAFADASQNGCEHSQDRAAGCSDPVKVPEPPSAATLAAGLLSVGAFVALFGRKGWMRS